jgi:hypothetical protein
MPELKYHFENIGIHESLIFQAAIEARQIEMSKELEGKSDRAIKAVLEELDLMYSNLDSHIAAREREQFYHEKMKREAELLKNQ